MTPEQAKQKASNVVDSVEWSLVGIKRDLWVDAIAAAITEAVAEALAWQSSLQEEVADLERELTERNETIASLLAAKEMPEPDIVVLLKAASYLGLHRDELVRKSTEALARNIMRLEDALDEAKAEAQRWIPVEERLPPMGEIVLLRFRDVDGALSIRTTWREQMGTSKWWWMRSTNWFYSLEIAPIDWQPLPPPPESED